MIGFRYVLATLCLLLCSQGTWAIILPGVRLYKDMCFTLISFAAPRHGAHTGSTRLLGGVGRLRHAGDERDTRREAGAKPRFADHKATSDPGVRGDSLDHTPAPGPCPGSWPAGRPFHPAFMLGQSRLALPFVSDNNNLRVAAGSPGSAL